MELSRFVSFGGPMDCVTVSCRNTNQADALMCVMNKCGAAAMMDHREELGCSVLQSGV